MTQDNSQYNRSYRSKRSANFARHIAGVILPLILISVAYYGCDGVNEPTPDQESGLIAQNLDSIWIVGSPMHHLLKVSVNPLNLVQGRDMICQIRGGGVSTHFRLYDDGGLGRWYDAAGFCDSISGDITPGNGVFSRRVNSLFTRSEGQYLFSFALSGIPPPETLKVVINVRANFLPTVLSFDFPDSVPSGASLEFSAVVQDSNGLWDIYEVTLICSDHGDIFHPMRTVNDSLWIFAGPSIAAGMPTGYQPIWVGVADFYLHQQRMWEKSERQAIWLENLPPRVEEFVGPDTVWLPNDGWDTFDFEIKVSDDQGLTDIEALFLHLTSDNDMPPWDTIYFDNGVGLDTVAGDGLFHVGFSVNEHNAPNVLYTFIWTPADRSPQQGEPFSNTVLFLPPEGAPEQTARGDGLNLDAKLTLRRNFNW